MTKVDAPTWLDAMPARVVKAADHDATVRAMLRGIPLPHGFRQWGADGKVTTRRRERPHLELVPISKKVANAYIAEHHRHNNPVAACVSVVGVKEGDRLCGVAIIRRPVARMLDDGYERLRDDAPTVAARVVPREALVAVGTLDPRTGRIFLTGPHSAAAVANWIGVVAVTAADLRPSQPRHDHGGGS